MLRRLGFRLLACVVCVAAFAGAAFPCMLIQMLASAPYGQALAGSELARHHGGTPRSTPIDLQRLTPQRADELFLASGGWPAAIYPGPAITALGVTPAAWLAGLLLAACLRRAFRTPRARTTAAIAGPLALLAIVAASALAPDVHQHPSSPASMVAGARVGGPVALAALTLWTTTMAAAAVRSARRSDPADTGPQPTPSAANTRPERAP